MTIHWLWRGKWFWGFIRLPSRPERWAFDLGPIRILGADNGMCTDETPCGNCSRPDREVL